MLEVIVVIALVLAIAIAAVLILAATKPDNFSIRRAASIKAPPERIFSLISDFHQWGGWSPWENKDPGMTRTFSGSKAGKGAVYAWEGNNNVGTGQMEIVEAATPSKVVIKLDFLRPFEAHNTAEFTMLPQGSATEVNWEMRGPLAFMHKLMHVFFNMDKMVGKDFETGLANLKKLAEA
ncbi:SRPBCC family protein [Bradyrhizobium sp. Tv2a-2]|uniref:SRPBCC family protein n=1 Tax=Bradyrhizobium sp. Tv2a-2 TaxID=113395 RepID=UPI0003FCB10E|nr:SRPBCC family protein [Bradyrhizobium sp. Tv2a-2]